MVRAVIVYLSDGQILPTQVNMNDEQIENYFKSGKFVNYSAFNCQQKILRYTIIE